MSHITDPPTRDPGSFGHEFNYSVWTPGTDVTLCNVPWNSDYRDIVNFANQAALDDYLLNDSGPTVRFDNLTYAKAGQPVRINLPFNDSYRYNYLRVRNAAQPVGESSPRTFFYFIRDVRYVAPNTTELDIQLDVWQTFGRHIRFGNCYVERGHVGIANSRQMTDNGREYLTIPEGFDLGSEYQIQAQKRHTVGSMDWESDTVTSRNFHIIVATTVSLAESGGTVEAPVLSTAQGSIFEGLPNGAELYLFRSPEAFRSFVGRISNQPWISQGIISVHAVPVLPSDQIDTETIPMPGGSIERLNKFRVKPSLVNLHADWRDEASSKLHPRYRHLKKFLTYPYSVIELTTYSGTPLVLKPESMSGDGIAVVCMMHLAPPSPRIVFYPYRYNSSAHSPSENIDGAIHNDGAEFLDMMTGIFNLPTFSIVNNSYISFMASNQSSIAYQHQSADWSQQRAMTGNQLGYDQASQNMALQRSLTEMGIGAAGAHTDLANTTGGYRALQQGINSVASGLAGGPAGLVGGAVGAVNAGVGHAIDSGQRNQGLAIDSSHSRRRTGASVDNAAYMRDTNKSYADFAAQGDYEMSISSINARVQDAKMVQPTTSGQMGGDAMNLVHYRWAIHSKLKMVNRAAQHAIGEFWLRYGYRVGRFYRPPSSLMVMSKFTYWKLRETYVTSSACPEMFRQAIRGIFEKGVTVWRDPSDIGNIDVADNQPLEGVTL